MKRTGLPLSLLLGSTIVILVVVATGSVGGTSYRSSSQALDTLWTELATQLADHTTEFARRFLEPAASMNATAQGLLARGFLDVSDPEALYAYQAAALAAHPTITWVSYADLQGRYQSVYRWPLPDGSTEIRRSLRVLDPEAEDDGSVPGEGALTWYRDDRRRPDGSWERLRDDRSTRFDPRTRAWFGAAQELLEGQGVWTGPALMHSRRQLAVFHSAPAHDPDGKLLGVWLAEFEAEPLSRFLGEVGGDTRSFILDESGLIVAAPEGSLVAGTGPETRMLKATDPEASPLLRRGFADLRGVKNGSKRNLRIVGDVVALQQSFPAASGLPWTVVTVIPAERLFGGPRAQARLSIFVGLAAVLVAILLGMVFSRQLAAAFGLLRDEMARIARFELSDEKLSDSPTMVREVNEIARTADTMKLGLQSFARYAPRQVVTTLLESGQEARLGAEPREVSILFTDIENFTTIAESTEPNTVVEALGEYLELLDRDIWATGGLRLAFLGDGVMALWGAPYDQPDHAMRACKAAIAMNAHCEALAKAAAAAGKPVFRTRIGVNSGVTLVGNIGEPERFTYTCLGDPVNVASRLEGLNKSYGTSVLIGDDTARELDATLITRPIDWVRAKGKTEASLVHQLIGEEETVPVVVQLQIDSYRAALELYRGQDFERARQAFEAVAAALKESTGEEDGPCRTMIERCGYFAANPPGEDWDGVFVMTTK